MSRAYLNKEPHEVAAMFDAVAKKYDITNDVLSLGQTRTWRKAVVAAVAPRNLGFSCWNWNEYSTFL